LPDRVFGENDELRLFAISLAAVWARFDLVERWLAARASTSRSDLERLFSQVWKADIEGDIPRVADAARLALNLSKPGSRWWHYFHSVLAPAEHMMGEPERELESLVALQWPLGDSLTPTAGSAQELFRALPVVLSARLGARTDAGEAFGELTEWLTNAERLGYQSHGIAEWALAMLAYYDGDIHRAAMWRKLPDDSFFTGVPLPPMIFRLDMARVRRAAGDNPSAARLLADVRRRLAALSDPGRFADWVAEEEQRVGRLAAGSGGPRQGVTKSDSQCLLSPREAEVLRMLCSEFTMPEISSHLFVSYNTVKTHTKSLYRKLGVRSRSSAVARARSLGYM